MTLPLLPDGWTAYMELLGLTQYSCITVSKESRSRRGKTATYLWKQLPESQQRRSERFFVGKVQADPTGRAAATAIREGLSVSYVQSIFLVF